MTEPTPATQTVVQSAAAPTAEPTPEPTSTGPDICLLAPKLQRRLMNIAGLTACAGVTAEDLSSITELSIGQHHLEGERGGGPRLDSVRRLEITGVRHTLAKEQLAVFRQVRELVVEADAPEGADDPGELVGPGVLAGMPHLEKLTLTGRNGWREHALRPGTLEGLYKLRELRAHYLSAVEPGSLSTATSLESVTLHGAEGWDEHPPRIPHDLFAGLENVRNVNLTNLRWPVQPLLLDNDGVVCAARQWEAYRNDGPATRPLSAMLPGEWEEEKDLESLEGCPGEIAP